MRWATCGSHPPTEQVFDGGAMAVSNTPKVKASQCFTKFKWRDLASASAAAAGAGGATAADPSKMPLIVATQVCFRGPFCVKEILMY